MSISATRRCDTPRFITFGKKLSWKNTKRNEFLRKFRKSCVMIMVVEKNSFKDHEATSDPHVALRGDLTFRDVPPKKDCLEENRVIGSGGEWHSRS